MLVIVINVQSAPVCTVEVFAMDLETGSILQDITTSMIVNNEGFIFTTEQLQPGRQYDVTVILFNTAGTNISIVPLTSKYIVLCGLLYCIIWCLTRALLYSVLTNPGPEVIVCDVKLKNKIAMVKKPT